MIAGALARRHRHRALQPRRAGRPARVLVDGDDAPRPPAMGLFGAIDDLGLTAGPALAAARCSRSSRPPTLMGLNAVTFAISAVLIATIASRGAGVAARARRARLFADARAGVRELAARPEIRTLLGSSTGVVAVHRHHQRRRGRARARGARRRRLRPRADGHRGRPRHRPRLALRALHHRRRLGLAPRLRARPALCMAVDLLACARRCTRSGSSSPRSRSAASATASRSSTTACCSPTAPRRPCTAACSRSRRPAPRSPSRSPSSLSGALIAGAGVQTAFLVCRRRPGPRARRRAPAPARRLAHSALRPPPALGDALA